MLKLLPVDAAAVPRVHVEPSRPDGSLRVLDRPTGEHLLVYTPRFNSQFRAGHRSGRWYVRPLCSVGVVPLGPGFATARTAVEAVSAGRWSFSGILADRRRLPLRVIWPRACEAKLTVNQPALSRPAR
jgi:hypothetical protein